MEIGRCVSVYFLLQYRDKEFKDTDMYVVKEAIDKRGRIDDLRCVIYSDLDSVLENDDIPVEEVITVGL